MREQTQGGPGLELGLGSGSASSKQRPTSIVFRMTPQIENEKLLTKDSGGKRMSLPVQCLCGPENSYVFLYLNFHSK